MTYRPASHPDLYIHNRKNLVNRLQAKALAVLNANDIMPTNADGTMPFRQNNDLLYLSGIHQEETILLLFPDTQDERHREVLFIRETNEQIAVWEGHKLTKEKAAEISGIPTVYWTHQFDRIFDVLMTECECVYLNTNEHTRATVEVETRDSRFIKRCRERFPLHTYQRLAPLMHELRAIKHPLEIALMQHAISITEKGFRRILPFVKPGVKEYEIEAEFAHEFIRHLAEFAYTPIIASGSGSCVLHYTDNSKICQTGDILLLDVGASFAGYASDMTRTIPVNGKFSPRQRQVYEAVLRVMKAATQMLVPGNIWDEYHKEVGKIMESELIGLGLLQRHEVEKQDSKKPLYKKYFMHGTSHFLGLDVHDVGSKYRRFEPGMVFTCEPGIYIPEESIGIRLENDILITEKGNLDLMSNIPLEAEEIEALMNG
jgi:Xaa-Pro aminopeptidase